MTYYEWVELFENIIINPRNEKYLEILKNQATNYKGNAETLFINHIVKVINLRLKNTLTSFLNKTKTTSFVIENLAIELNEIKKEVKYLNDIISFDYIPKNKKIELKNYLNNAAKRVEDSIKLSFKDSTNAQIIMLIKNLNLTEANYEL